MFMTIQLYAEAQPQNLAVVLPMCHMNSAHLAAFKS